MPMDLTSSHAPTASRREAGWPGRGGSDHGACGQDARLPQASQQAGKAAHSVPGRTRTALPRGEAAPSQPACGSGKDVQTLAPPAITPHRDAGCSAWAGGCRGNQSCRPHRARRGRGDGRILARAAQGVTGKNHGFLVCFGGHSEIFSSRLCSTSRGEAGCGGGQPAPSPPPTAARLGQSAAGDRVPCAIACLAGRAGEPDRSKSA
jgi:hypothetical protein